MRKMNLRKAVRKVFGGVNLNWCRLIILALAAGVYTAAMALIPTLAETSFHDIAVSFEVWILLGIFIIVNSKSAKESALKCFVFFLISQPLVYLLQVPFSALGWGIFGYYKYWAIWTLLTLPMGYIGYYLKREKWWSLLILTPILLLLGSHLQTYLSALIFDFPHHLLTVIFCFATLLLYPLVLFKRKMLQRVGLAISAVIAIVFIILAGTNQFEYQTVILYSGDSHNVSFDDNCNVDLNDERFGKLAVKYNDAVETYVVEADLRKTGVTDVVLHCNETTTEFELTVNRDNFNLVKK